MLGAEENDAAAGDLGPGVSQGGDGKARVERRRRRGKDEKKGNELVMAKSRINSSALGALSHSTRLALGNSRPMMGVTSKCSYWSRIPESLRGSTC